mmetsp:Transcript_22651/g.56875  ORF Transcript_22651/g.56875 Transcript_22651/m.56875 type:complete len:376 (-) Transcript_22651:594-1721(-)
MLPCCAALVGRACPPVASIAGSPSPRRAAHTLSARLPAQHRSRPAVRGTEQQERQTLRRLASAQEPVAAPEAAQQPWESREWEWKNGWRIKYAVAGEGPPLLLVHGFGASLGQFRKNIPVLADAGYKVYAVDLLGFGGSSKPAELQFTMQVWAEQLVDFVGQVIQADAGPDVGVVMVGNSLGSLAAIMANSVLPAKAVRGTVLLNCAAGMNNKAVKGDWRIQLAMPLFLLIDFILKSAVGRTLFDNVRQPENIRGALQSLYSSADSVDQELVDLFYQPSCDEGAADVFISVYTGPEGGPSPLDVLPALQGPLLVLWGEEDRLTPRDGPVGRAFEALPELRPATAFVPLPDCGHCLHDDRPDLVHAELLPWLAALP